MFYNFFVLKLIYSFVSGETHRACVALDAFLKVSLRNATLSDPHRELSNTALRSKHMGKGKAFWKGDARAACTGMLSYGETDAELSGCRYRT